MCPRLVSTLLLLPLLPLLLLLLVLLLPLPHFFIVVPLRLVLLLLLPDMLCGCLHDHCRWVAALSGLIKARGLQPMFGAPDKLGWLLARGIFGTLCRGMRECYTFGD
jgi:hypothetical protein